MLTGTKNEDTMFSLPFGIRLSISPYFWVLIILLGWINSASLQGIAIWAPVIFISVLIHELGHALTARAFGQVSEIELVAFGGVTRRTGGALKTWQEFLVVFDGPLFGFMLFGVAYFIKSFVNTQQNPIISYALEVAIVVNLFWTVLNLLPVIPLDGGHLMKVLLEGALGLRGTKIAYGASLIMAILLSVFFFVINFFVAGVLFVMLAFESYRSWSELRTVTEQDTNPLWHQQLQSAQQQSRIGRKEEALSILRSLQAQAKKGAVYDAATVGVAQILADQGNIQAAFNELLPLRNSLSPNQLRLLQQWAYQLKMWPEAVELGRQAYQELPSGQVALTNALACAIMGQLTPAIGWLKCARQFNLPGWKEILTKQEFDVIRESPEFKLWNKSS